MTLSKQEIKDFFMKLAAERRHSVENIEVQTKKTTKLQLSCNRCGTVFHTTGQLYSRAGGIETKHNLIEVDGKSEHFFPYSCPGCKKIYKQNNIGRPSGEAHPQWKGGLYPEKREGYIEAEYKKWRQGVFSFYKGKCFLTNSNERDELEAHHMDSWYKSPEKRYDVGNGVLICKKAHVTFHRDYGKHTTREQFEQFSQTDYNITLFPWVGSKDVTDSLKEKIVTQKNDFKKKIEDLLSKRNYELVNGTYENKKSMFDILCPEHEVLHKVAAYNLLRQTFGLACCAKESPNKTKPPSQKGLIRTEETLAKIKITNNQKCQEKINKLATERSHQILEGTFENQQSCFRIYCTTHKEEYSKSYFNYCRSKSGLKCCSAKNNL